MDQTKRNTLLAITAALAICISAPSFAGRMDTDERLERMTSNLSLTEDQVEQIRPLLENQKSQMQAFRKARQAERGKLREEVKSMRDKHMEDLKGILNEEQFAKLEEQVQQRMEYRKGKKGHFGGDF